MSSVVNKSGTRFVPKIRQRRVATPTPSVTPSIATSSPAIETTVASVSDQDAGDKSQQTEVENTEKKLNSKKNDDGSAIKDSEEAKITLERKESTDESPISDSSKNSSASSSSYKITGRRRSSRLDSLSMSSSKPVFKPNFNDNNNVNVPGSRRLSTISGSGIKKIRINSITEDNSNLQDLKKRRMSSRSSASKKTGSAHRISIVTAMESDDSGSTSTSNSDIKNDKGDSLFRNTDSLYDKKFQIRNVKEIPKNIEDLDSARYVLDEHNFTIAELCKPVLPIGEISDNFERAQQAAKAKITKRKERRELRKRARSEFKSLSSLNDEEDEKEKNERIRKAAQSIYDTEIPENKPGPNAIQLKMNKEGVMEVDELSTVVDRHKNASYENSQKVRVQENPFENLYNSATYGKNSYTDPWTNEELIKFYKALSMWGTDFNLISQLFPYRTRKQVKSKFINEEKRNPVIIELALRSRLPPDFDRYCAEIKKNIGTLSEFNEKLEELRNQHEEHLKEIEEAKLNAKNEDLKSVKKEVNKKTSGGLMTNQLKSYRKSEIVLGTIDDVKKQKMAQEETTSV
ncbi:hypothetical protein Kpol_1003p33 [Vanderwaltozyma polyspora DSM 70294]|uniref:SANT domain-containing protein n=1 Tax=Vanderwaltozyma polyspora (strain ATCC 22028 / DSM 70294 / BCRC 21397 / CBS 2163 / NBRC 10782 / NRRL Y-8283 / UCD 57-17) TaxID=436907 RepID=A7TLZ1_VANPO|nr:uncharacterized protein Kpol_1003p33 [Vanderwaltozyma polyspora DSM 70294]EDO16728.1 hypothetical protein Kpol_1003p33 [Vanderwaltozyma polyspora DSM 70294]